MMTKRNYRVYQSLLALMTSSVVAGSFYVQYIKGLQPCPLCFMQRLCACVLMFFLLVGLSLGSLRRAKHVVFVQGLFAAAGLFFALRQVWLQFFASHDTSVCMPGLEMLVRYFPWRQVVNVFFWGSNGCADVTWYGLGLSMAAWSALYFGGVLFFSGLFFVRLTRASSRIEHTL